MKLLFKFIRNKQDIIADATLYSNVSCSLINLPKIGSSVLGTRHNLLDSLSNMLSMLSLLRVLYEPFEPEDALEHDKPGCSFAVELSVDDRDEDEEMEEDFPRHSWPNKASSLCKPSWMEDGSGEYNLSNASLR